jgi:hypothetical protein
MGLWLAVHLTAPPVFAWRELRGLVAWRPLPGVDVCHDADQDHVLLVASDCGMLHTSALYWQARGCAQPRTWRVLSASQGAAIVLRDGDASLEVRALDGASVLAVTEGRPTRVRYTFERSLDDPRVVLWMITPTGFEQVPAPAVGRGRPVPYAEMRFW